MFLAIDIGNTHTTLGVIRGGVLERTWRIRTERYRTSDELAVTMRFLPGMEELLWQTWTGCAICSVVPSLDRAMVSAAHTVATVEPRLLNWQDDLGIENAYPHPHEVGMDRLVNAVAGAKRYGAPLVVVDLGTATTLDIVDSSRRYLGGIIMAGVETTVEALSLRTAKLPIIRLELPKSVIGKTTVDAIRSGLLLGCVEAVEGLIRRIEEELDEKVSVVLTGGLASMVRDAMRRDVLVDEHLTLWGIHDIWSRMQPPAGSDPA